MPFPLNSPQPQIPVPSELRTTRVLVLESKPDDGTLYRALRFSPPATHSLRKPFRLHRTATQDDSWLHFKPPRSHLSLWPSFGETTPNQVSSMLGRPIPCSVEAPFHSAIRPASGPCPAIHLTKPLFLPSHFASRIRVSQKKGVIPATLAISLAATPFQ